MKMNAREKSMLIVIIVLFVVLTVKSVFLDEVKNLEGESQQFKDFVEYSVDEKYEGVLTDFHIMTYRVYKMFIADESTPIEIEYVDPNTNDTVRRILSVRYTAGVRGYLFGIIPVKQFSVTAKPVAEKDT
ncbi:MAG: hypothetical protein MJA31_16915 [Clostridia bacterium]|nr:hypothetical protein [Clostridia bacterium]